MKDQLTTYSAERIRENIPEEKLSAMEKLCNALRYCNHLLQRNRELLENPAKRIKMDYKN